MKVLVREDLGAKESREEEMKSRRGLDLDINPPVTWCSCPTMTWTLRSLTSTKDSFEGLVEEEERR